MLLLTEVVDHILPEGTRRVAGPPITAVPVSRVAVLSGEHRPTVDRATLAIVDSPDVSTFNDELLSTAPAALVVSSNQEVPAFAVDYPILMLAPGVAPPRVAEVVTSRLQDQQARLAVQGIDVYRRLAELAIGGKGIPSIASAVAVLLSLPVAVADEDWRPICSFGIDGTPVPDPEEHILKGLRDYLRPILERERLSATAPPVYHIAPAGEPHAFVAAPIVLPSGFAGCVWADSASTSLFPLVDITVGHAAAVCAIEMARQRAVIEAQLHLRGNFVEELLTDGYRSIGAMRQRARFLGHDLEQAHAVAVFDIDHFARYIAAHPVSGEGAIIKLKERFTRLVAEALAGGDPALLWQHSDEVVALLPVAESVALPQLTRRIESARATVQARLGGPSISAGVGRVYQDPAQLHRSYVEAREAVRIGLTSTGTSTTTPFDKLGVYRLLFRLRETPELESFCEELLGPLERYDKARGTDLVYTLRRYLACNCNVARATEELHLHRNGLLYRLQRISELTGADFGDARQRLSYHLALLARTLEPGD
ncbi:MAG TPA: helix-turn-helix domain-containing protein [Chloroflexota bacterium]|nr:helix-turn-helix domain-containing protein [Chloroflexota bacterium]